MPPPLPVIFSNVILLMLLSPTGVMRDLSLYEILVNQIKAQHSPSVECYLRQVH